MSDTSIPNNGRWVITDDGNDLHTSPINDLKEHKLTGTDCECNPIVSVEGACLVIMHNSFDHREITEEIRAELEGK